MRLLVLLLKFIRSVATDMFLARADSVLVVLLALSVMGVKYVQLEEFVIRLER